MLHIVHGDVRVLLSGEINCNPNGMTMQKRSWLFGLLAIIWVVAGHAESPVFTPDKTPIWAHKTVAEYPHNPRHFTQGLLWHDGQLIESTGLYGESGLYIKELKSGETVKHHPLDRRLFGEGITVHQQRILQLTWREGVGLIYSLDLEPLAHFSLTTQGWGLTGDGERLWMTDGSATLYELSPENGKIIERVTVREQGQPVGLLNELEWIDGLVFANRFGDDDIVIIDPNDGTVVGRIKLGGLRERFKRPTGWSRSDHVLNGIAWRPDTRQLLVTGKSWPTLFALQLDWPATHSREPDTQQQ
jgi:glutaminyl-peptide cyclotransferase